MFKEAFEAAETPELAVGALGPLNNGAFEAVETPELAALGPLELSNVLDNHKD